MTLINKKTKKKKSGTISVSIIPVSILLTFKLSLQQISCSKLAVEISVKCQI